MNRSASAKAAPLSRIRTLYLRNENDFLLVSAAAAWTAGWADGGEIWGFATAPAGAWASWLLARMVWKAFTAARDERR